MSGFPNRRQLPNQEDIPDNANDANQRLPAGALRTFSTSGPLNNNSSSSLDNLRSSQDLMAASALANPTGGFLPPLGASRAMASSWQDQLDITNTAAASARTAAGYPSSLFAARMAHAQQRAQQLEQLQQQQQQLQMQQQQQQQAAAAAAQEELEFNNLLRQKRHIDDMILNSAFNTRRFSMDSGLSSSLYGGAGAAGRLPGQAAAPFPLSMVGTANPSMTGGGGTAGTGTGAGGVGNVSNHPILGESDLLSGKIRGLEGQRMSWAEQSRRLSDPSAIHPHRLGSFMMGGAPGMAADMPLHAGAFDEATGGVYEEDDETYFNDAGTDEVDRDFKRSQENFPLKLYRIIYEVVKSGRGDVISFFPHGRAFAVHKPKEFINEIMPKYFATGRMNTFLKQLNLYGFRRITEGRDKGGYFHPKFILGKRHLCKVIKRKKTDSKPAAAKQAPKSSSAEAKEADATRSSPLSTEEYAKGLRQQMGKQSRQKVQAEGEAKSPSHLKSPNQETR